jgi:long-chain fatty acid transport protein
MTMDKRPEFWRLATAVATAVVAASIVFWSGPGRAAGFQISAQSASGLGTMFAGQAATADDAGVVWSNPAGLTRLEKKTHASFALHVIAPSSNFNDQGSCSPYAGAGVGTSTCPFGPGGNLGHSAGGDGGTVSNTALLPTTYLAVPTQGDVWAGVGVTFPFGLKSERDPSWIGRFRAIDSRTRALNINPTVAFKTPVSGLSIGLGVDAQYFQAELSNAVSYRAVALGSGNAGLIAAVPPGSEGVAVFKGHDWGFGWNVGAQQTFDQLVVGIAYRSAIHQKVAGSVRFDGLPAALAGVPQLADGPVRADVRLPDMLSLAAAWQATGSLTVLADLTRTGWDSIQDLVIVRQDAAGTPLSSTPLRFKNSWRTGAGLSWRSSDAWTLRAGIAWEASSVTDAFRNPRLPDSDRMHYAIGARWSPALQLAQGGLTFDFGLALTRLRNAPSALPNQESASSPPQGSLVGSYSTRATTVAAQVNWSR